MNCTIWKTELFEYELFLIFKSMPKLNKKKKKKETMYQ